LSITTSRISDPILKKIEKTVKDPKERQFLIDLLERELSYIDKDKPEFRKEFKIIIEQRFPFRGKDNGA
jgi:hypothetical protein